MGRLRQHGPKNSSDPGGPASEATSRLATSLLPEALVAVMPQGQLQRGGGICHPHAPASCWAEVSRLPPQGTHRQEDICVLGPGEGRSTAARAAGGAPGRLAGLPYGSVSPHALAIAPSRCSQCPVPSDGPGRPPAAGSTCFSGPVPGGYVGVLLLSPAALYTCIPTPPAALQDSVSPHSLLGQGPPARHLHPWGSACLPRGDLGKCSEG